MKKSLVLFTLVLIAATFLTHSSSLNNQFTNWDDESHLLENEHVLSLNATNLKNIFSSNVNQTYIPLTTLSFALEHHFFGFNPRVYHFNNLLLHVAVTVLCFVFFLKLGIGVWPAFLGAGIFGLHPMHVESVAWVTERKDVLYSFFYMLSLIYYLDYLSTHKKKVYASSLLCGLLSILAKPMALSLPLILLLCDWFKHKKISWNDITSKLLYFLYIIPIALITYYLNARSLDIVPGEGILIWIWSFTFYIQKFFIPDLFLAIYTLPDPVSLSNTPYLVAVLLTSALLGCIVFGKKLPLLRFALMFYFCSIFFLLRYDAQVDITIVADRFMYLPSVGICLWLGYILYGLLKKIPDSAPALKMIYLGSILVLFLFLGQRSFQQNNIWDNSLTLWNHTIKYGSEGRFTYLPYYNRGKEHAKKGNLELALADYNKAIAINKNYPLAYNNRALLFKAMGQFESALADINKSLRLEPDNGKALNNRGIILDKLLRYNEALLSFNKALEANPDFFLIYNNRGLTYLHMGLHAEALGDFSQAIKLYPLYDDAYFNRGNLYKAAGEIQKAISDYTQTLELNPNNSNAANNLGTLYLSLNQNKKAIKLFSQTLKTRPDHTHALNNRGSAYQREKKYDLALTDFNKAIALNDQTAEFIINRGMLLGETGKSTQAIKDYDTAIRLNPEMVGIYFLRSNQYALMKQYEKALEDALQAKKLGYPNIDIYIRKLEILMKKK